MLQCFWVSILSFYRNDFRATMYIFRFPENNKGLRYKRETEKMDFGCDNHATALGAASLSLLIRNLVETAKPEETGS